MRFFQNPVARHDVRMVQLQEERDLVLVLDQGVEILLDRHLDRAPPSRAQHLAEQHGHHEREKGRGRGRGGREYLSFGSSVGLVNARACQFCTRKEVRG